MVSADSVGNATSDDEDDEPLRSNADHAVWRLFAKYARPYKQLVGVGVVLNLVARALEMAPPFVLGVAFDAVLTRRTAYELPLVPASWIPAGRLDQLWFTVGLMLAISASSFLISWATNFCWNLFSQHMQHDVRVDTYDAAQALEMGFFESSQTGNVMSVLNNDVNSLGSFFFDGTSSIVRTVGVFIGVFGFMFLLNWQLALVAVVLPVGMILYFRRFRNLVGPKYDEVRDTVGALNARIENSISGIQVIKSFAAEGFERNRVADASRDYFDANWEAIRIRIRYNPGIGLVVRAGFLVVLTVGGYWVVAGPPLFFTEPLTAGALLSFLFYARRMHWPINSAYNVVNSYEQTRAAAERVIGLQNQTRRIEEADDATDLGEIDGHVAYDDVTFSYRTGEDDSSPVLRGVSFEAEPGETVGLVGPTGAGKTTLVKLLLRFYDVDEGAVSVGGHDVREVTLDSLRESIGYVSQDPFLFNGTVRENIAYAMDGVSTEDIEAAARAAGAHDFIAELDDGYDTSVGNRGASLSGGQRQRISIARAILKDPDILVLDEATSHVDNRTEVAIQSSLDELVADRTTFAIAHQLSTVRDADAILVMEDGEVVERGTHDDLLDEDGLYANLWKVQVGQVESLPEEFVAEARNAETRLG